MLVLVKYTLIPVPIHVLEMGFSNLWSLLVVVHGAVIIERA